MGWVGGWFGGGHPGFRVVEDEPSPTRRQTFTVELGRYMCDVESRMVLQRVGDVRGEAAFEAR